VPNLKSFRCSHCGFLEGAESAAECAHPHACRVCGRGVKFDQHTGLKSAAPGHWECLHSATDERLAELGLARADVRPHTPWACATRGQSPASHERTAGEGVGGADSAK
jgi:hypothetical protein